MSMNLRKRGGEIKMDEMKSVKSKKKGIRKMSGWIIALIVVAVMFTAGAICCNTIGKTHEAAKTPVSTVAEIKKE